MPKVVIFSVLLFCLLPKTEGYVLEKLIGLPSFRIIRKTLFHRVGRVSENPAVLDQAKRFDMMQVQMPEDAPFPCSVEGFRSSTPPTGVHEVRPGDIDVIGAMGDSLTVGQGVLGTNLLNFIQENRGLSWSGGGQKSWREFVTLPNILKEFNPNLIGYSLRDSLSIDRESQFNVAESGAVSSEMPYMAKILVKRIKNDPRVDVDNHWKLITYLIGPNDICGDVCFRNMDTDSYAEEFRNIQIKVLRTLRDGLPRTIVNLAQLIHLKSLTGTTLENQPKQCFTFHSVECPCLYGTRFKNKVHQYYEANVKLQKVNEEVAAMDEFQTKDFAVVLQPFSTHPDLPRTSDNLTDYSYMSYDCFHLSQKMNAAAANSLWNNMLEPVGQKSTNLSPVFQKFLCPTEWSPYIFTKSNSIS